MKLFQTGIFDAIQSATRKLTAPRVFLSPWKGEECIVQLHRGDATVKVFAFDFEANHRSYLIEVANANGVSSLLFTVELDETIDALIDARQAITQHERTYLED